MLEILLKAIRQKKVIKGRVMGKEEVKWPLFADDMIVYVENGKKFTHTKILLPHEFSKFSRSYKINMQKPIISLHVSNEQSKMELRKLF